MLNPANHSYALGDETAPALKPHTVYWQWILMNALLWPGMMLLGGGASVWLMLLGSWGLPIGLLIMSSLAGLLQAAVVHSRLPRLRWRQWALAQCVATGGMFQTLA